MSEARIDPAHLQRRAFIYVRQLLALTLFQLRILGLFLQSRVRILKRASRALSTIRMASRSAIGAGSQKPPQAFGSRKPCP